MTEDLSKRKYITDADVILMLPGRRDPKNDSGILLNTKDDDKDASLFIDSIKKVIDIEIGKGAKENVTRYNLGKVFLHFMHDDDMPRKDDLDFEAFLVLSIQNKTKLCVFEIYIKNCDDTVQMLECFRNNAMSLAFSDKKNEYLSEDELYDKYQVQKYGSKRSIVFAYNEPNEKERAHCLANELTPVDGDISGILLDRAKNCDRSQYSGVSSYASSATLLECIHKDEHGEERYKTLEERFFYQASEIYFVEILMFRDASATNIQKRLDEIEERQIQGTREISNKDLIKISRAIVHADELFDINKLPWPTVRFSSILLMDDFGITGIEEKCRKNNEILQELIERLKEEDKKSDEKIKTRFLFAITALSAISPIYGAIEKFKANDPLYLIAIGLVALAYLIYRIIKKIKHNKEKNLK